jgi:hypothetical protein
MCQRKKNIFFSSGGYKNILPTHGKIFFNQPYSG